MIAPVGGGSRREGRSNSYRPYGIELNENYGKCYKLYVLKTWTNLINLVVRLVDRK
jgi:hypothetical protein